MQCILCIPHNYIFFQQYFILNKELNTANYAKHYITRVSVLFIYPASQLTYFQLGLIGVSKFIFFKLKTRPRPKTKLPKLVEIVPDMYPDLLLKTFKKISEKGVHRPAFSNYLFITPSRGWQRVAEGNMTNWHTLMVQMHMLCQRSGH